MNQSYCTVRSRLDSTPRFRAIHVHTSRVCRRSAAASLLLLGAVPAGAQNQVWLKQLGSGNDESAAAAAADGSGGLYAGGSTNGSLGAPATGGYDAWLAHYDGVGNQSWIRQFGSGNDDHVHAVALGSGGVYACGATYGALAGNLNSGGDDAWLARYDGAGNQLWLRMLGTGNDDSAHAVVVDAQGNVFVCGETHADLDGQPNSGGADAWLARYDNAGNVIWVRLVGSGNDDYALTAATDDAGGVFVGGHTNGNLGGNSNSGGLDAWLARYDNAGNQLWLREFGSGNLDELLAAAPDGGAGVFVGGRSNGSFGGVASGGYDAWLARYDGAGNQWWIRQFGSGNDDSLEALALMGPCDMHLAGRTSGSLGAPSSGGSDAWGARYNCIGSQVWIRQFGSGNDDSALACAPDGVTGMFVCGGTVGTLGAPSSGGSDVWFAHYDGPTNSAYCIPGVTSHGCTPSIGATGTASASAGSGFTITIGDVEGQKSGLIFYGIDNTGYAPTPWGASSSYLCVKPPTQRTPLQFSAGTTDACDGVLAIDWNAYIATHPSALGSPFPAGRCVFAQAWFRDPPSPKTTMLSDALQFVVRP